MSIILLFAVIKGRFYVGSPNNHETLGDLIAHGGCTIIYLLGQQFHFELFNFWYQALNMAEVDSAATS